MSEFFLIAEIISEFRKDGSVILKSYTDFPQHFFDLEKIFVDYFGNKKELSIEFVEEINNSIVVKFDKFNDREDVQFLIGKKLYVDSKNLYELPDSSYYLHDLIGSEVYRDSLFFGKLVDVLNIPGNDVYVIENNDGKQIMIPGVEEYFENIDIDNRKLFLSEESEIFNYDEDWYN